MTDPVIRGNSLYTIVDGPSWTQAEANAQKVGGHLVSIGSAEENQFVYDNFKYPDPFQGGSAYTRNATYPLNWIGLTDKDSEG